MTAFLTSLPAWLFLLVAFALPALEASAFAGFAFPGETALVLGGALAAQGRVSLAAVVLAGVAGAVVGDSVGYAVGRRFGRRLLTRIGGRWLPPGRVDRAAAVIARRGPFAVFLGRFTLVLRVLVPGLAGMSGMRYRSFLLWNVLGAVTWAPLAVLIGYLGGTHLQHLASAGGVAALVALAVVFVSPHLWHRRYRPTVTVPPSDTPTLADPEEPTMTPDDPETARTVIVVPTFNEAANIGVLLDRLADAAPAADVLVVDDNSPDGTAELVRARADHGRQVHVLVRPGKDGLGAAYRAGFAWALERGYASIVQMDADLSHPPERVPALVAALAHADLVVGSRYVPAGAVEGWPWSRRLISWAGNAYVRIVLDLGVRDATAGFKAFRRDALIRIGAVRSDSDGYCFQVENTWRAVRLGLRVEEVPITFRDRTAGTSKMSGAIVLEAVLRVLFWRWRDLRARATRRAIA